MQSESVNIDYYERNLKYYNEMLLKDDVKYNEEIYIYNKLIDLEPKIKVLTPNEYVKKILKSGGFNEHDEQINITPEEYYNNVVLVECEKKKITPTEYLKEHIKTKPPHPTTYKNLYLLEIEKLQNKIIELKNNKF